MPKSYLVAWIECYVQAKKLYKAVDAEDCTFWQIINDWRNGTLPKDLDAEITNLVEEFIYGLYSST